MIMEKLKKMIIGEGRMVTGKTSKISKKTQFCVEKTTSLATKLFTTLGRRGMLCCRQ